MKHLKRLFATGIALAALVSATAADAQSTQPPQGAVGTTSTGPAVNWWYIGATGGAGAVQSVSGVAGAEAGVKVWGNLDLMMEGGWVGNLETRRQRDQASTIATFLGPGATSSVTVPGYFVGVGARYVFENSSRFRPYVLVTVGGASINVKSTFSQNGVDVTNNLAQSGVTLGQDLQGKTRPAAVGGGAGVVMPWGNWYLDVSVRVLSLDTLAQRTNLTRLSIGFGRRF